MRLSYSTKDWHISTFLSLFVLFIISLLSFLFILCDSLFFFVFRLILCVFVSDDYIFIGFWCPGQSGKPLSESVRGASWRLRSIIFISLLFFKQNFLSKVLRFLVFLLFASRLFFPFLQNSAWLLAPNDHLLTQLSVPIFSLFNFFFQVRKEGR